MRFFIEISYFGKNFHGWQIQENASTIQEEVDNALSTLLKIKIKTLGSGRTDSGVHALNQVAHFDYHKLLDESFLYRLNAVLSKDIAINSIKKVKDDVNARFDAISREYIYKIHSIKSPFLNDRSLFYPKKISMDLINDACAILLKHTDFKTFSKVKTDVNNYNCQISKAEIKKEGYNYYFTISSDRFLRGMVRAIMGTMIKINEGKISLDTLNEIILKQNRKYGGPSVPAHGLYLSKVLYDKEIYI